MTTTRPAGSTTDGHPLVALIQGAADLMVVVIGYAVLDGWLEGLSHRLSREAPVPIVDVTARRGRGGRRGGPG